LVPGAFEGTSPVGAASGSSGSPSGRMRAVSIDGEAALQLAMPFVSDFPVVNGI
jgi:hypothetical protein